MICVFTGGDSPNPKLCETFFNQISLNEKIISIAADSGLKTFEEYQKHFGFFELKSVLGDWDSLSDKNLLQKYPKEIIENHIVDKDFTDTELALEKAKSFSDKEKIVLIGAGGGERIDHLLAVFDIFSTELRPDVWISGKQFLYFLKEGSTTFIKNLAINDMISVFRTTTSRTKGKIESKGLMWESNLFRKSGVPSISNRISPDYFSKNIPIEIKVIEENYVLIVPNTALISQ